MTAAVRDIGVAINWRITLLGLNLAAWLVGALAVAILLVRHEMSVPSPYPGFGYSIPMFTDFPVLYPAKIDPAPVVDLKGIGRLRPAPAEHPLNQVLLGQHQDRGLTSPPLGAPRPLSAPEAPRPLKQSAAH